MKKETQPLDPEIQAVLEDVAKDPRSHLLRVPRVRVPLELEPAVSPGEAFLTKAERQILEVHRAEVAQLLLARAQRAVYEHPTAAMELHRQTTVGRQLELADPVQWQQRAKSELEHGGEGLGLDEPYSLLQECVGGARGHGPLSVQLALASLRLVPRVETRLYLALGLHQAGRTRSALGLAHNVVAGNLSALNHSIAWGNIGFYERRLGRPTASLLAYRESCCSLESRIMPAINWLILAFMVADKKEVMEASSFLVGILSDDDPSVRVFLNSIQEQKVVGKWETPPECIKLHREIADTLPHDVRRITSVLS